MLRNTIRHIISHWIQQQFEQVLYRYAKKKQAVYVVQVGANDGKTIDPLYRLMHLPQVKAVLVEAVPFIYEKLCLTHSQNARVSPFNKVVVPTKTSDTVPFYYFQEKEGLEYKTEYSWWGSLDEKYMSKYTHNNPALQQLLTRQMLSCVTMNELFNLTGFPQTDILHTDVEGLDVAIINTIDFNVSMPDIILFEHMHANYTSHAALLNKLQQIGYKCYIHGFDTLCIKEAAGVKAPLLEILLRIRPGLLKRPLANTQNN